LVEGELSRSRKIESELTIQYKGHLSNISENTLMTAVNDEGGHINIANDGNGEDTIPKTMQKYKQRNEPWMLVVDDNCKLTLSYLT
jgi:hypothetical protein